MRNPHIAMGISGLRRIPGLIPAASIIFFLLAGIALIPWPGLQNDELFFAGPLFDRNAAFYYSQLGTLHIPLMVISYTGALKTWLYAGLLATLEPSPWVIRIPALLAGAATIWLTWIWMNRMGAGAKAATIATLLLATDTSYLLTTTFDWGPVALQHLLLMSGLVCIQIWIARRSRVALAVAFLLWGLGLWDKALMLWPLTGLAIACCIVYWREMISRIRLADAAIALACFAIGAMPLIWFNIARPGETASRNLALSTAQGHQKIKALRESVDGSEMFGFIVKDDNASRSPSGAGFFTRLPLAIKSHFGTHRRNLMPVVLVVAVLCFAALWRSPIRRPLLFLGITMAVAWAEMFFNKGTGVFVHHVVLLWPFPFVFAGIALASAAQQFAATGEILLAAFMVVVLAANVLTTNEYLAEFITNGGAGGWTDAIYRLAATVDTISAPWIGLVDWGCLNGLRVLHQRDVSFFVASDFVVSHTPTAADLEAVAHMAGTPGIVFIQHVADKQIFPGVNDRFRAVALQDGFEEQVRQVIPDRNGHPVFELFSLRSKARALGSQ
ncbi:MAG TPA: hypothetical protein VHZ74_04385 [Bryobacteraceae bacterium]|nr:hypothetical protein [Bryobacteraceae bacterium]